MELKLRKAIAVHHTDTSDDAWDGPGAKANLKLDQDESYYKKAYAWQDEDADAKTKAAYKFIHHNVDGDGNIGPANLIACSAGIAVLNGGRGGTTIPSADKQGVWEHLGAHLKDADKDVPELKSAVPNIEYRTYSGELRVEGDGGKFIVGHAAVFNEKSLPFFGMQEVVEPGAFKKTIKESDIRALFNHNPDHVLGRNRAGTLELSEDKKGLLSKITPPDTQWANDLKESIRRGDISQMSFGFRTIKDSYNTEDGMITCHLEEVRLFDVSPVTYPAYPQTDVSVRAVAFASAQLYDQGNIKLFRAMEKLKSGEELRAEELALLKDFATKLQNQLSEPGGAHSGPQNEPPKQHSVNAGALIRQLELLEIEIQGGF